MTLQRQVKENVAKKPLCSRVAVIAAAAAAADSIEETALCVMLRRIPKETVGIVVCLSRLAYQRFFDWYCRIVQDVKNDQKLKFNRFFHFFNKILLSKQCIMYD